MKNHAATLLALATLFAGTAYTPMAEAGRPLRTEDAGVLDRGDCEVEGVAQRLTLEGGGHASVGSLQVGCGVGWRTQVALNASRINGREESGNGLAVVGKTNLWRSGEGDDAAGLTLAWNALWTRASGESLRFGASELTMVYSRPLPADLTLHANLGHIQEEIFGTGSRGRTTWALALEHDGFGPIAPMGEVFGSDRGEDPWWNLALRWTVVPEKFFVDGSYGRQFGGHRLELITVGFKFAF